MAHHFVAQRYSEQHADFVMEQADAYFSSLSNKNIFQPKVLVKVSRNSQFFVGCSLSASSFLRPHCLHNRIFKFKRRLKEAVVLDTPLHPGDQREKWSSSAFMRGNKNDGPSDNQEDNLNKKRRILYTKPKEPCRNCQVIFQNLVGFIPTDAKAGNRDTFQGACAEYIPVNELIKVDAQDPSDDVQGKLAENLKRCKYLFRNYNELAKECHDMDIETLKNDRLLLTATYYKIKQYIHIFGFKPELKM